MNLGLRIASLCLAFVLASGLLTMPEAYWESLPPPSETTVPAAPPGASPEGGMDDVAPTDWFYRHLRRGFRHGFLRSIDGRFEPRRGITRAEFVTMLGRTHVALGGALRYGERSEALPYTDVAPDADFTPYLVWATELGLVQGDAEQRFRPDEALTRESLAVILARYLEAYAVYTHLEYYDHGRYEDWELISTWAYEAVHLLRDYGLMQGSRGVQNIPGVYFFRPQDLALRFESAVILVRLFDAVFDGRVAV